VAWLYNGSDEVQVLKLPAEGGSGIRPYALDDGGRVVGTYYNSGRSLSAFLYQGGVWQELGVVSPLAISAYVWPVQLPAANSAGQRAGYISPASADLGESAVRFEPDGNVLNLSAVSGGYVGRALGINEGGDVVGNLFVNGGARAFAYVGGELVFLDSVVQNLTQPGVERPWILSFATSINEQGQIAGYGYAPNGSERAFVLTPVPEPASSWLMLLGCPCLVLATRRHRSRARVAS
jgi:uncharacterized membrane protein